MIIKKVYIYEEENLDKSCFSCGDNLVCGRDCVCNRQNLADVANAIAQFAYFYAAKYKFRFRYDNIPVG